jgi:hypothetical protein
MTLFSDEVADYVFVPYGGAESIAAVILGERFPRWQLPAATSACDQAGVELLQVQWDAAMPYPEPVA